MAKRRAKISKQVRIAVYERDSWTCQYCGQKFDRTKTWTPQSLAPFLDDPTTDELIFLEIDHIHPLALGGTNDSDNLRAACSPCNKKKLATTRETKWDRRIRLAVETLETGPATEETAMKAAALLLGYLQRELPRPRGVREAGF